MSTDFLNLTQQDVFDIRDVIERYEELADDDDRDETEFQMLAEFLEEVRGYGGDEQWRGDWYPVTFIRESYFVRYAEEFAEDIGAIDRNAPWPANCIDWVQAARELRFDYSCVCIGGCRLLVSLRMVLSARFAGTDEISNNKEARYETTRCI